MNKTALSGVLMTVRLSGDCNSYISKETHNNTQESSLHVIMYILNHTETYVMFQHTSTLLLAGYPV